MTRAQYFVAIFGGRWYVKFNGKHFGPYPTQTDASEAAREAAKQTHANGGTSQVLIQGEDNKFRTEWTYGNDPYPPKG